MWPRSLLLLALVLLLAIAGRTTAAAAAEGQMTWAVPFSLAPAYFEPAEAPGLIAPFLVHYARHDALVIQQLMHDKAMFVPIMEPALLNGYGPRVAESGLGLIAGHAYSAPYEDVKLKSGGR